MARKETRIRGADLNGDGLVYTFLSVIILLLAFFILLCSFSTVDKKRLEEVSAAFKSVLSGQAGYTTFKNDKYNDKMAVNAQKVDGDVTKDAYNNDENTLKMIRSFIQENHLSNTVDIAEDSRGVILQLKDSLLFEPGSADLISNSKVLLDKISELLAVLPNDVIVEGHTDNRAISTYKFESNWEFSAFRAINVVRYFTEVKKINAERFSAAGYGEHKPLVDNDTTENRAKNRRINILIKSIEKEKK